MGASTGIRGHPEIFAFVLIGPNLIAGTVLTGIYLSTNGGLTWIKADTVFPSLANTFITHFSMNGTNLFAGTDDSGVILSRNFGTTWTAVNSGLPFDSVNGYPFVGALGVSGTNVFEGGIGGGVFLSTDNGTTWLAKNHGLTSDSLESFGVSGTNVFAGTSGGHVFLTTDNGSSWNDVSEGLNLHPNDGVTCFLVNGTYLLAGTTNGIWRRQLSEMIGVGAVTPLLSATYTLNAYPNPFTQSTTINFTTPESGVADVSIINILGTEVARIFSGELSAEKHSFSWNANGFEPGTYWCQIRIGGETEQIPVVLGR